MPHEWNDKIVVTKEELVPKLYSWPNLKQTIHRYQAKPTGIKRVQLGGNGRPMLIDFDTLPLHVQHVLGDPRQVSHPLEKHYRMDNEAVGFFTKCQLADGSYLSVDYQDEYITNASVLKAIIGFREDIIKERTKKALNKFGIDAILCDHVKSFQKTLQVKHKSEHTLPEGEKRFKQVLKAFENKGYESLISGKLGNSNSRKVFENTTALLESMFAKDATKPTATEVHRAYDDFIAGKKEVINNESGEVYNPAEFKKLSVTTVTNYLSEWQSKIATYASRSGDRQKYMQSFKPYHSYDKTGYAGSLISIDDRQPPFAMYDGERVWFYNAIDLGSEAFTCWVYGKTKESIIVEFYRQLVRNYAEWGLCLPDGLEAEMSLNSSYVDSFLKPGAMFQNVRIEANNARGKRIEAYYRPLRYGIEKKREGWLARPSAITESNQIGGQKVPKLHYDAIIEGCLRDIETWNNMPHSVHKNLTRWEVFTQMQHPDLKPINYNSFLLHLGRKTSTSCKTGIIKLQGSECLLGENGQLCFGDRLIDLMKHIEGENIDVYWLDGNNGTIIKALVYLGKTLICEAVPKPIGKRAVIEQTEQGKINYELMSKYVATIEAYGRRRKKSIDAVTIIDNTPAPEKKFIMPGLKQRVANREDSEPEILPEPNTDDFINQPETSYRRSFKDRF